MMPFLVSFHSIEARRRNEKWTKDQQKGCHDLCDLYPSSFYAKLAPKAKAIYRKT